MQFDSTDVQQRVHRYAEEVIAPGSPYWEARKKYVELGFGVDGLVPRRRWLVSRVRELENALVASSVDARWPYTSASNASIDHTRRYINRRKRPPSEAA